MRVEVDNMLVSSYKRIIKDANTAIGSLREQKKSRYLKALFAKDVSIEHKKKWLAKALHELIIKTFSLKKNKGIAINNLKVNIGLIRGIIHKMKDINNYLEVGFLKDIGIINKAFVLKAVKSKKQKLLIPLPKGYMDKIEATIHRLMQEIIFFDKKLLKDYGGKEIKLIRNQELGIRDMEGILTTEDVLLDALEAKMPPANRIKPKLLKRGIFNNWVATIFALLSGLEAELKKENFIFSEMKKKAKLRKKIENKIRHIINEKERIQRLKEKRALSMKKFHISDDFRQAFHEYISAANL